MPQALFVGSENSGKTNLINRLAEKDQSSPGMTYQVSIVREPGEKLECINLELTDPKVRNTYKNLIQLSDAILLCVHLSSEVNQDMLTELLDWIYQCIGESRKPVMIIGTSADSLETHTYNNNMAILNTIVRDYPGISIHQISDNNEKEIEKLKNTLFELGNSELDEINDKNNKHSKHKQEPIRTDANQMQLSTSFILGVVGATAAIGVVLTTIALTAWLAPTFFPAVASISLTGLAVGAIGFFASKTNLVSTNNFAHFSNGYYPDLLP